MEAEFWEYMEKLVPFTSITIDRPKGLSHPRYPDMVYPVNYGYLEGTRLPDNSEIDVWIGSNSKKENNVFLATIDLNKMDSEIKLVIGCSDKEISLIQDFHNSNGMRTIFVDHKEKSE